MFIYEKDGTLDIMFQKTQFPAVNENSVDILLKKVGDEVQILINGSPLTGSKNSNSNLLGSTTGSLSVFPTEANITAGGDPVILTVSNATGTIKCSKKAEGSTSTGLSRNINGDKITVTAGANATAGIWIYTVSDDNDSVDVTFTVSV